jgi:hypothetical protein
MWSLLRQVKLKKLQQGFRRDLNQQEAPSPNDIRQWVKQWREEGSVTYIIKPPGRRRSVRTPENAVRLLESVQPSPRRLASRHSVRQKCAVSLYTLT